MTTGTVGSFPLSPLTAGSNTLYRGWSGSDGKWELHNGFSRIKWNNFSCDVVASSVSYPFFQVKREFIPNPSGPGGTVIEDVPVSWNNGLLSFDNSQYYTPSYRPLSEALDSLLAKVKGHEFNLGVDLAQGKQTVNLLTSNLRKLGRAALSLRRGNFKAAARELGAQSRTTRLKPSDISGRWLELQYGWLPLISSSYNASVAFAEIMNGPRKVLFRASSSRSTTFNLSTAPSSYSLFTGGRVRVALQYEMYEEMSAARQLGLQDPLSIAWELTPWSFVIDWFVPIGTYLSNLNQIPTLKGRWLVTSSIKCNNGLVTGVYLVKNFGGPNWRGTVLRNPSFRWSYSKVVRSYLENPPEVPRPQFRFGLNPKRMLNAIALAYQRFLG